MPVLKPNDNKLVVTFPKSKNNAITPQSDSVKYDVKNGNVRKFNNTSMKLETR